MTDTRHLQVIASPAGREPGASQPLRQRPFERTTAARQVLANHVIELRQAEAIDDATFRAIARAIAAVAEQDLVQVLPLAGAIQSVADRVENGVPEQVRGIAALGLAREEWGATVERMAWRHTALDIAAATARLMEHLTILAGVHAVTVMPVYAGGRFVQPTTLAHFLGGVIEPLRQQRERLRQGFERLNRSPFGAGSLAGGAMGTDRDDAARRLGFAGPVASTFDAVSGVEHAAELVDCSSAIFASLERFITEVSVWIRTDPTSFLVDERWLSRPEPMQPTLEVPSGLDDVLTRLREVDGLLEGVRREIRAIAYGPVASRRAAMIDHAAGMTRVAEAIAGVSDFVSGGLIVNRAYLGNRAGCALVTGGDLAFFLVSEEGVPPAAATEIAGLVLARLHDANLEVSSITQDMIDSAALLVIGQEVKVEMETLGRYLAPRRYLERRQVTGSAAPAMTREWLALVEDARRREDEWLDATITSIDQALADLDRIILQAAEESPDD